MKKSYGWSWINVVGNATAEFNKNDFLRGKVFWFIDEVTNVIYSVKKDADSRTGINFSGDKNMAFFCSDRLKSSYEMVWFMVNRFSDDRSFVTKIGDSYLKVNSDLKDRIAILRLMSNMGFDNYRSLLNSYNCGH